MRWPLLGFLGAAVVVAMATQVIDSSILTLPAAEPAVAVVAAPLPTVPVAAASRTAVAVVAPVLAKSKPAQTVMPITPPATEEQTAAPATTSAPQPAAEESLSLPYRAQSFSDWVGTWGDISTSTEGALLLHATTTTSGAEAMLPLSSGWSDYRYTAQVAVSNGDITLMSRYANNGNDFVACTFSNNWIGVEQRVGGVTTTVTSTVVDGMSSSPVVARSTSVSMRIEGDTVGCTALGGGDNLTYTFGSGLPPQGGIGIETWFNGPNTASLELQGVDVEPL